MEDFAIRVTGLSKKYNLQKKDYDFAIVDRVRHMVTTKSKRKDIYPGEFYALNDINFEIKKGESIGIIGYNGAGKSTLLKLLSEVVVPTEGKIDINGSVASVLEMGMGFHPELTGKENIFLSGTLMGIPKRTIENRFNDIIDFAEIGKFVNTAVKFYSSGMFMRLAFSIAVNINADILLFDEVLAVGDIGFQMKCQDKIQELSEKKKTMILVSHNLSDVQKYCQRFILLEKGRIKDQGNQEVIMRYFENTLIEKIEADKVFETVDKEYEINEIQDKTEAQNENVVIFKNEQINITEQHKKLPPPIINWEDPDVAPHNEYLRIMKISAKASGKNVGDPINIEDTINFEVEFERLVENAYIGISLNCHYMKQLLFISTPDMEEDLKQNKATGFFRSTIKIKPDFLNIGIFSFGFYFTTYVGEYAANYIEVSDAFYIKIGVFIDDQATEKKKTLYSSFQCPIRPRLERYEEQIN